mmetsp:Transcript_45703/g.99205  ORF Transcript_45703/g.99205 Transcript_45703/m.99205 type:complete len:255 (+) Transcript_45703:64-828(+)
MSVCGVNSVDDRWGPRAALTAAPPQNFGYQGAPAAGRRNGGISGAPRREPSNERGSGAAVRRFQAPACANVHAPTRRSPEGLAGPVPQGDVDIATVNAGFLRKPDQEMIMELYRDAFREENAAKEKKGLKTTNSMPAETAFGFIFASKGMLVARIEGQIVGFSTVERDRMHNCWIRCLVVHPGLRRKGLGSQLLNASFASFPASEHRVSYWKGRGDGLGKFYEKHGFQPQRYSEPEYVDLVRTSVVQRPVRGRR